jgi:hypothetical protein
MGKIRRKLAGLLLATALVFTFTGCQSKLQPGGAYAPTVTNSDGTVTATFAPDKAFFTIDAGFDFAYAGIQSLFAYERDNRAFLKSISPDIKKTLDSIRPDVVRAVVDYGKARNAYKANPTPAGLSTLRTIEGRVGQLASAAQAVIPKN